MGATARAARHDSISRISCASSARRLRLGAWAAHLKGVPLIRTAAAERGFVDAVIQPRDTRKKLI
jgi:acetyl-CoA carboxylase carboxyltransferase component